MSYQMYRQGDVVFLQVPKGLREALRREFSVPVSHVLKEGEQTGHKHEAVGKGVQVLDAAQGEGEKAPWRLPNARGVFQAARVSEDMLPSTLYLTSTDSFKVVHPEHGTLTMQEGDYLVFSQREYGEEQNQGVRD